LDGEGGCKKKNLVHGFDQSFDSGLIASALVVVRGKKEMHKVTIDHHRIHTMTPILPLPNRRDIHQGEDKGLAPKIFIPKPGEITMRP